MEFVRSVVVAYAGFAAALAASSVLARIVDLQAFGDITVALAAAEIAGFVILLGGQGVVQRFLPPYLSRRAFGSAKGLIQFFAACSVTGGAAMGVAGAVAWVIMGRAGLDHVRHEAVIAIAMAPLIGATLLFEAAQQAAGQPVLARLPRQVIRPLSLIGLAGLWLLYAPTMTALQAVGIMALNRALVIGLQLAMLGRILPFRWSGARRELAGREWIAVGLPMLYAAAMNNLAIRVDVLALEAFHPAEHAVGAFSLVTMIASMCWVNYGAVTKLMTWRLSGIETDIGALNRLYRQTLARLGALNLATAVGVSAFAGAILDMMHPDLAPYAPWLVFAVWGAALNSLLDVASQFVRFAGLHRVAARWATPLFAAHVAVTVGAVLAAGVAGAFVSLVAMRMLRALVFVWLGYTRLGLRPWAQAPGQPARG